MAEVQVSFELGFDEVECRRFSMTRFRNPEIFTVVRAIEVEGHRREPVEASQDTIDLKTSSDHFLPAETASAILGCATKLGEVGFDCYRFVGDSLGVSVEEQPYLHGWQIDETSRDSIGGFGGYAVRLRPPFISEPDRTLDHWFVPLTEMEEGVVAHVRGKRGPLMISPVSVVEEIYPGKEMQSAYPA